LEHDQMAKPSPTTILPTPELLFGDALDILSRWSSHRRFDLIVTDPPYAFSGHGCEHELTATVAIVLREAARRLTPDGWMLVMCATSWRGTVYMVEALRNVLAPVRIATWCKPQPRTKVHTSGWRWASVNVVAFRNGKARRGNATAHLDHITAPPLRGVRRAQLPPEIADWLVTPYAVPGGHLLDPFAGSGEILRAANRAGMHATGIELTVSKSYRKEASPQCEGAADWSVNDEDQSRRPAA
jgi:site-specific DNA-methyltransferase (adenine-specific)